MRHFGLTGDVDMDERQVDQETVAIIQAAEHKCGHEGLKDGRRDVATEAEWQSSEMLSVARGSSSSDLDR